MCLAIAVGRSATRPPRYSRQGNPFPPLLQNRTRDFRPFGFAQGRLSSSSSVHEPLSSALPGMVTRPWSLAHARSELDLRPVFSTSKTPAIRPGLILPLCRLVYRPHVSLSQALPRALASWGIRHRQSLRPGRLLQRPFPSFRANAGRVPGGLLRSVCHCA
jgi:hypothetical protein